MAAEFGQHLVAKTVKWMGECIGLTQTRICSTDEGTSVDSDQDINRNHALEETDASKEGCARDIVICSDYDSVGKGTSDIQDTNAVGFCSSPSATDEIGDGDLNMQLLSCNLFRLRQEILSSIQGVVETKDSSQEKVPCVLSDNNVLRPVPTLVELCLQTVTECEIGQQRASCVPGLSPLVRDARHQRWLHKVRFDWLLKALLQAERSIKDHLLLAVSQCKRRSSLFLRDTQNIDSFLSTRNDFFLSTWNSPRMQCIRGMLPVPESVDGYDASDWCVAVLAHCINMLVPTTVSEPPTWDALDDEANCKTMVAYVSKVRHLLSHWVPQLAQHCFDTALAYVWWTRGNISTARQLLAKQIHCIDNSDLEESNSYDLAQQKALYSNELGRLMASADQPNLAFAFYRDAVEYIQEESAAHLDTIKLHSLVLGASAFDQGIMDRFHAERAKTAWDTVLCEPNCPPEVTQAALVSMLHCHTGVTHADSEGNFEVGESREWLKEMESRVHAISLKDPNAWFHLSLVRALLGQEDGAQQAYANFERYFGGKQNEVPGFVASSDPAQGKSHPWQIFSKWTRGCPAPSCMPLLWRRLLGYPRCILGSGNRESPKYGPDVSGETPNFGITKDGFLTGAFIGNLPPMTSFLLDPFTGKPIVPDQSRRVELQKWNNFHIRQEGHRQTLRSVPADCPPPPESSNPSRLDPGYSCGFRVDTFLPTPIHLLTNNKTGAVCSLLISNTIVNYSRHVMKQEDWEFTERSPEIAPHIAELMYSSGSEEVKVDLLSVILQARRNAVLNELLNNDQFACDPGRMKDAKRLLEVLVRHKRQIRSSLAHEILVGEHRSIVSNFKNASQSGIKKQIDDSLPPPQTIRLSNILHVGEHTVILNLVCATEPDLYQSDNTLVFVNCDSAETFKQPMVHFTKLPCSSWVLPEQTESWNSPGTDTRVFFAYESVVPDSQGCSKNELFVFDERGVILMRERNTEGVGVCGCHAYVTCFGWHLLGLDKSGTQLISFDAEQRTCRQARFSKIKSFRLAGGAVFVVIPSGVFALDPLNLTPVRILRSDTLINDSRRTRINNEGLLVAGQYRFLRILASNISEGGIDDSGNPDGQRIYKRVFLGLENRVLILQNATEISAQNLRTSHSVSVRITADVAVPGIPNELCYISHSIGFVVTATVSNERHLLETETLYWFDMTGRICGVHPMLGPSPHGIIAVPLKIPNLKTRKSAAGNDVSEGRPQRWHLYFADGFGGICCMRLNHDRF